MSSPSHVFSIFFIFSLVSTQLVNMFSIFYIFAFYEAVQTPGGGIPLLKGWVAHSYRAWELLCLVAGHIRPGRDPKTYSVGTIHIESNSFPRVAIKH